MPFLSRSLRLFALLIVCALTGCNSLVLRPDDSTARSTGKMVIRGVLFLPTFGASERRIGRHRDSVPITDGYQTGVFVPEANVVVVGNNHTANNAAITWLQKRGVSVVERTHLDKIFSEQELRLIHSSDADLLQVGRLVGASEIVFVEASATSVSVRSVELESGKIGWTGSAQYRSNKAIEAGGGVTKLACQALATALGFRRPGDLYIPSQEMCDLHATVY